MGDDMVSLNLSEIDVEQLEQRIELGQLGHITPDWCNVNDCHDFFADGGTGCNGNYCSGYSTD